MIKGIGLDVVELDRIERLLHKSRRFEERVLTTSEREQLHMLKGKRKVEFAAGRYAAKEAFAKAAGTGISKEYGFQDIEVYNDSLGKPVIKAKGLNSTVHISITHSHDFAAAQVIVEK
ncbi:holo-[acyl-carrier-protein] synthase [Alteribacillus persepolensis]|uniref:Holo-[acyl-carrier-protein] synthase n=1 Tax=Alteribacillus persepolensis TaxID=568899 RepID=A0A1G8FGL7_9BACI|nr:holo-ACP synthase [Alteribacillus persepolensis]SDH81255.1 holo-[acyl-carrier-protein] synthase [Alteribacillus persepolensis]